MSFALICILAIAGLGIVAAIASWGDSDDEPIVKGHDCASCAGHEDGSCKIACLLEEKRRREGNKDDASSV